MCRVDTGCCLLVVWACLVLGSGLWILTSVTTSSCAWFVLVRLWVLWGVSGSRLQIRSPTRRNGSLLSLRGVTSREKRASVLQTFEKIVTHFIFRNGKRTSLQVFQGVAVLVLCLSLCCLSALLWWFALRQNVAAASTNPANPKP